MFFTDVNSSANHENCVTPAVSCRFFFYPRGSAAHGPCLYYARVMVTTYTATNTIFQPPSPPTPSPHPHPHSPSRVYCASDKDRLNTRYTFCCCRTTHTYAFAHDHSTSPLHSRIPTLSSRTDIHTSSFLPSSLTLPSSSPVSHSFNFDTGFNLILFPTPTYIAAKIGTCP